MDLIGEWQLETWPPTANHMTCHGVRQAWDTPQYSQFKAEVALLLRQAGWVDLSAYAKKPLKLQIVLHWNGWFTKDGRLRENRDTTNRIKPTEDAVYQAIGFNDSYNVSVTTDKCRPRPGMGDAYIVVRIWALNDMEYRRDVLLEEVVNG